MLIINMGLLELVRSEKDLRRIFGKQELKIIEKQLLGINLSASEKTRLSRDIKPKFEVIRELSDFKKEFSLKKAQEIKYLINEAKEEILESGWGRGVTSIVVFGSFVENQLRKNSDIDLAVSFSDINVKEATKFRVDLSSKVSERVDVQVFNVLPEKLKKEINEKGRVIYKK
jgi:predicted nucleotidyltransferase